MQKVIFLLVGFLFGISAYAQNAEEILLGKWTNPDETRVIEFVQNGGFYEAIILKSDDTSFEGRKQITHLKYHKNGIYKDGMVHVFKKDRTLACKANLLSIDELELSVSFGFMSKSAVWTRVEN
ncbi:Protein of unknown function DUF2147 [Cyclobacterium marinum DSM 745]|uniref:Uncharacterized protein n=2 Tax=Cyclobacterium marinum TaxID=104 RepID=G0IUZ3_CYCMS|nr:Protein of unknown function DUF2147 [Cyclobacterium marinum DSM 745]